MRYLLDTHVWIWSQENPERLGTKTRREGLYRAAIRARKLWKEVGAQKLKGDARILWVLQELKRDLRTDERQLRRILARCRDGA